MKLTLVTAVVAAITAAVLVHGAFAKPDASQHAKKMQTAKARFYHADGYIKAIGKNARRTIYHPNHAKRMKWVRALRYLVKVRSTAWQTLHPAPLFPPHHALWMCIHGHEAGDWHNRDTGANGHYGGLQMHPGWGYGTSYYASDDDQLTQEWAAERGWNASGQSVRWLFGQWAHPDCAYGHDASGRALAFVS